MLRATGTAGWIAPVLTAAYGPTRPRAPDGESRAAALVGRTRAGTDGTCYSAADGPAREQVAPLRPQHAGRQHAGRQHACRRHPGRLHPAARARARTTGTGAPVPSLSGRAAAGGPGRGRCFPRAPGPAVRLPGAGAAGRDARSRLPGPGALRRQAHRRVPARPGSGQRAHRAAGLPGAGDSRRSRCSRRRSRAWPARSPTGTRARWPTCCGWRYRPGTPRPKLRRRLAAAREPRPAAVPPGGPAAPAARSAPLPRPAPARGPATRRARRSWPRWPTAGRRARPGRRCPARTGPTRSPAPPPPPPRQAAAP